MMQLDDGLAKNLEHGGATGREVIVASAAQARRRIALTSEPAITLHPLQKRIQRARADPVPMPAKLFQDPLTHHRFLGGVMKDVDLPKAEEDLPGHGFMIDNRHVLILEASQAPAAGNSRGPARMT